MLRPQLQYVLLIATGCREHLGVNVMALTTLHRRMAENATDNIDVLRILDRDRRRGTVAKEVRVYRMTKTRFGQPTALSGH